MERYLDENVSEDGMGSAMFRFSMCLPPRHLQSVPRLLLGVRRGMFRIHTLALCALKWLFRSPCSGNVRGQMILVVSTLFQVAIA